MTPYNYPEPLRDIERTINVWAQHKAETGADVVNAKMAEIKALLAEKLAELRALPDDPARRAADERYAGMHPVHTINNVALTIWGLNIGGDDFTKVIGETVAMGLDNDCTAASIFGAAYRKDAIPEHWTRDFNNKAHSYIIGKPQFAIDDMVNRFTALAAKALANA